MAASQQGPTAPGQHHVALQSQIQAAEAQKKIQQMELQQLQLKAALAQSGAYQHPPAQPPSSSAAAPTWDPGSNSWTAPPAKTPDPAYAPWAQYLQKKDGQKGDGKGADHADGAADDSDWRKKDKSGLYGGVSGGKHWWYFRADSTDWYYEDEPDGEKQPHPPAQKPQRKQRGPPVGRVEKAPAKNSPAPSAKVTPRDLGTIPEGTPPNGEITPLWYWHYDQNAGTHKEAYQRRCLLNDSLCSCRQAAWWPATSVRRRTRAVRSAGSPSPPMPRFFPSRSVAATTGRSSTRLPLQRERTTSSGLATLRAVCSAIGRKSMLLRARLLAWRC